jgi:hypothetical protein
MGLLDKLCKLSILIALLAITPAIEGAPEPKGGLLNMMGLGGGPKRTPYRDFTDDEGDTRKRLYREHRRHHHHHKHIHRRHHHHHRRVAARMDAQ